jgi:TolB-like protein/DNA-binding winged helix-turn-helix (wHTH) protein/thioredoxin-like negative regulator of GroEL
VESIQYYDFEVFRLDVKNEQLLKGNEPIPLTHKAFRTLYLLVQNFGHLVKKEDIISEIWHDSFVEEANLTQHIYILRKTLGNNQQGKPFIETIPKRGYIFNAEVKIVELAENYVTANIGSGRFRADDHVLNEEILFVNDDNYQTNFHDTPSDIHFSEDPNDETKIEKNALKISSLWMTIAILGFLMTAFFLYQSFQSYIIAAKEEVKSIAVLPFRPIETESSNAKLGFGMADAVITRLSKLQKIPVRPTSAIFRYTDKPVDPISAGKELGVDSVLEGTVQRDGEQVRVSLRLVRVSDGKTLWAETFDERFTHIFALQDSISIKVANSLSVNPSNLQKDQLTSVSTTKTEAYEAYQLGIYFWNKRTKEDLEKAAVYFQKAVEIDNRYALAYAMLADSYNLIYYYDFTKDSKEVLRKADEATQKALALNDSLPEAYIADAFVKIYKSQDFDGSIRSLERAIQLSPYNPTARIRYGWQLLRQGKIEETYQQMRIAQENDPLSPVSNSALCSILLLKRENPEALKYCQKAVEIQPTAPMVKIQLASVYFLNGRPDEAVEILKAESQNEQNKYDALGGLAYVYAKTGKVKEAEEIYLQLKREIDISRRYSDLVLVSYALGKREEALENFKLMVSKLRHIPLSIISDPYWEELFRDDDFRRLIPQSNDKNN